MVEQNNFESRLRTAAEVLGLGLTERQAESLLIYLEQLQKWNRTYNLTAVRDPSSMLVQHVFDSLSILPNVTSILDKKTVESPSLADVGSGAGLPGVILAIMRPEWHITCIDGVEKKMAFVRQVAGLLGLSNLR